MLLEFSLENWGSFASERTLSLVASSLKDDLPGRVTTFSDGKTRALNTAIIFGKNGSGKSTLVSAMKFVRDMIRDSSDSAQSDDLIDVKRCRVEKELMEKPSSFRVVFSVSEIIYQYSFSVTEKMVVAEELTIADRSSRFRRLYNRTFDSDTQTTIYSFGESLKGPKNIWQSSTRDNALFLSTANQLNSESLREPFRWLTDFLRPVESTSGFDQLTAEKCLNDNEFKNQVLAFLREMDINVADIRVESEEMDEKPFREMFSDKFLERLLSDEKAIKRYVTSMVHIDADGDSIDFDLKEESTGTQALFKLAGPIFDTLNHGFCLVIDEINTNLHPLVLKALVSVFSDEIINKRRAQLVFTSHDTSMLRDHQFRRDEVWFTVADKCGRSDLIPLSDFSPRKGEAIEKGYLGGRYGGIPFISSAMLKNAVG